MNELLRIEGLMVATGPTRRLHGIDLVVGEGETVAVLGGAGAGKSALLGAIMGLHRPEAGRILLGEEPIGHLPPDRILARGVALSTQHRRVFGSLSVTENLLLGAVHRRRAEARDGLERVFELMPGLAARRRRPARELTAPDRRLLDIGRALLARPVLLLLDEPCRDLEPERIRDVVGVVRRAGTAVLIAERVLGAALSVADYGYLLIAGHVLTEGPAGALWRDERVRDACLGEVAGAA